MIKYNTYQAKQRIVTIGKQVHSSECNSRNFTVFDDPIYFVKKVFTDYKLIGEIDCEDTKFLFLNSIENIGTMQIKTVITLAFVLVE